VLIFEESIRGLTVGSPIEFFGLKIGEVADITFEFDYDTLEFRVPVLIKFEPERLMGDHAKTQDLKRDSELIARGWRAQLGSGNLVTGSKVINFVRNPDAPPAEVGEWRGYPTFPTIPSSLRNLAADIGRVVDKIEQVPFNEIGANLNQTVAGINEIVNGPELKNTIASLDKLADQLGNEVAPALDSVLTKAELTLDSARRQIDADSVTSHELRRLLTELGDTAQSIRTIVEYLERNPEALIKGKEGE
jgi:paraquat-inducible protein B